MRNQPGPRWSDAADLHPVFGASGRISGTKAGRRELRNGSRRAAGKLLPTLMWGVLLPGTLLGGGVYLLQATGVISLGGPVKTNYVTTDVVRGDLEIKVSAKGNLDSASNVTLVSEVEGTTTIIRILPEGTAAKKGQVLVELDSSKMRDQYTQQQIKAEQADASYLQAMEKEAIQRTQNESDIAAAELKVMLADLDLEKYEFGEFEQKRKEIQGKINLAKEKLTRAEDTLEFSMRNIRKGYVTVAELEANKIAVSQAQNELALAEEEMRVLVNYDKRRQLAEKRANAEEFKRDLERVKRKASAALAQATADLKAAKLTSEVEKSQLDKLGQQIEKCKIIAPQDGEVVYANLQGDRRGDQQVVIQEGATVRERQAIINLPDFSKMQVTTKIHESRIGMVSHGLKAKVKVDAVPGRVFNGVVESVSSVPISGNWRQPDLREYLAVVRIVDPVSEVKDLKPGLTAEVQIMVETVRDALLVPIQSVAKLGKQNLVFVVKNGRPEMRKVSVGKTNDEFVQLLEPKSSDPSEGVAVGDQVLMNPWEYLRALQREVEAEAKEKGEEPGEAKEGTKDEGGFPTAPSGPGTGGSGGPGGRGPGGGPGGGGPGGRGPGGRGGSPPDPSAAFARSDKNSDGKLSTDEVPSFLASVADLDKNGDTFIDLEEFKQGLSALQRARGAGGGAAAGGGGPAAGSGRPAGGASTTAGGG